MLVIQAYTVDCVCVCVCVVLLLFFFWGGGGGGGGVFVCYESNFLQYSSKKSKVGNNVDKSLHIVAVG